MDDATRTQLLEDYHEAEQALEVADEHANDGDVRRAAINYSRAAGLLVAAIDRVLDAERVPA